MKKPKKNQVELVEVPYRKWRAYRKLKKAAEALTKPPSQRCSDYESRVIIRNALADIKKDIP